MCTCIPLTTPLPHYLLPPYPYTPQTHMCTCIPLTTTLPPTAHPTPRDRNYPDLRAVDFLDGTNTSHLSHSFAQ